MDNKRILEIEREINCLDVKLIEMLGEYFLYIKQEAQKELLEEIENEVNLSKGNWSEIIERKKISNN